MRLLRFHGSKAKVDFELVGYNSRLDEIHAAALRIFLPHLDEWTALRREAAERYRELGLGERRRRRPRTSPATCTTSSSAARPSATVSSRRCARRRSAVPTYYLPPLHLQPALSYLGYEEGALPETEKLARENFSVPLWAGIAAEQQERVVDVVRARRRRAGRMTLPDLAAPDPQPRSPTRS